MPVLHRRLLLGASAALLLGRAAQAEPAKGEPITMGVSGPLTGPNAQYGAQWKQGFDLALDEINADGGIKGRPLAYMFEDSQSDPRQSVAVAQKFVADPKIVVELGDFSSPASMAASPIYQRGRPGAVRLHQLASRLHQGRRLHVEQLGQPGRRAAAAAPPMP